MRYRKDWEKTQERFTAFWNHELLDRCCISVTSEKKDAHWSEWKRPVTDEDKAREYMDIDLKIRKLRESFENTYYGGDSFPIAFVNYGASGHAGYFKGERHYFDGTVWFYPFMKDLDHMPEFDRNSELYRATVEYAKALCDDSCGDYIVSLPDATGNADALSHMMGAQEMMTAMIDEPEKVSKCLEKIQTSYETVMKEIYGIVQKNNYGGGAVGWLNTWAPGFHAQMQCDMSVMISNDMFKQFIMPELRAQCSFLEYPLYHLDGIEQARHLDDLLSIPELKCIQWTQVEGQKPCTEYFDDLKKIQTAGKNLLIIVRQDQIRPIMENLSSRGLYLLTYAGSEDEAESIVKDVAKWTHD